MLITPLSIVRFLEFGGIHVQPSVTLFVASFFALVGLVDVVLFIGAGAAFGVDFSN